MADMAHYTGLVTSELVAWLAEARRPAGCATRRRAAVRTCRECGRWVVVGLDADLLALSVHADPAALCVVGRRAAGLIGTPLYGLDARGRLEPGEAHELVLPAHACGRALPPSGAVLRRLGAPWQSENQDDPPY